MNHCSGLPKDTGICLTKLSHLTWTTAVVYLEIQASVYQSSYLTWITAVVYPVIQASVCQVQSSNMNHCSTVKIQAPFSNARGMSSPLCWFIPRTCNVHASDDPAWYLPLESQSWDQMAQHQNTVAEPLPHLSPYSRTKKWLNLICLWETFSL